MRLRPPKRFWLPKSGNSDNEYEDSSRVVYPSQLSRNGRGIARIAIADGATESAFAKSWSAVLTEAFVRNPPTLASPCALYPLDSSNLSRPSIKRWSATLDTWLANLESWLADCQQKWEATVPWDRIPWHGEAKAKAGALATLLGVTIRSGENQKTLRWQAVSVGDCCLFVVRDNELTTAFPLDSATHFNNTPPLICSRPGNPSLSWEEMLQRSGECWPDDLIILASDALAQWLLSEQSDGHKPWETLLGLGAGDWEHWVTSCREAGSMRDDDTTLLLIQVE